VPTVLQYPLERERDVQRRWKHLLQRLAPKDYSSDNRKALPSPPSLAGDGAHCVAPRQPAGVTSAAGYPRHAFFDDQGVRAEPCGTGPTASQGRSRARGWFTAQCLRLYWAPTR
jgi:hypothetical protein